ncbi:hypothetical protein NQ317_011862 [Molorchus minor]|uniref:Odorant receptor n=1 Tax=Molorchus minor TaxID=1323400 RepID=A0ABQ9J057_9CUCU|nr:hypothetical protein NQ317_011862 [Molorchus minor]
MNIPVASSYYLDKMIGDFDYSSFFSQNIIVYKLFGFWRPDKNTKFKILYNCYTAICTVAWVVFLTSQITYIYKFIDKGSKLACISMFYWCLYLGLQTDVFWSVVPFIGEELKPLARGSFPYNLHTAKNYLLTYIFQCAVLFWNTVNCSNQDTFTCNLLIQVGLQCDILCATLDSLDKFYVRDGILYENVDQDKSYPRYDERFSKTMTENLIVCIKHHKEIIRMARHIEDIHQVSVFILFIGGSIIICSVLFQLTTVPIGSFQCFMLASYAISMFVEQFIYCWFGNEVIHKSGRILNSAYNTPWVDCDIKFRKILLMFLTNNQQPIKIMAGGLLVMSVPVYVSVTLIIRCADQRAQLDPAVAKIIRTSYSYFTLLKKIQN